MTSYNVIECCSTKHALGPGGVGWEFWNMTNIYTLIARFMGPTWDPFGTERAEVGPMLAPWTLLSGTSYVWLASTFGIAGSVLTSVRMSQNDLKVIRAVCGSTCEYILYIMMTSSNGNIFRVTGHLCGEFTGLRWIPRTKASDAELWCFLWCPSN